MANSTDLAGDPHPEPSMPAFISRSTPHEHRLAHHLVEPPPVKLRTVAPLPGANRSAAAAARMAAKNPQESDPNNPSNVDIMSALRGLGPVLDRINQRLDHVERSVGPLEPAPTPPRDTEVNRGG